MSPPAFVELKGRILALGALKWSSFMIAKELLKSGFKVSGRTVLNVLRKNKEEPGNQLNSPTKAKEKRRPRICTPRKVKKVKKYIALDNPPTQREMARRVGVSQTTINCLIHENLESRKFQKIKVHHLTLSAIAQRKERALHFHSLITDERYRWILTMDEAMLPMDYQNGVRKFYYDTRKSENRRKVAPLQSEPPSWPQQRMYAAGYGWCGGTRLYIVEAKAKVNAEYFIEHILSPMMLINVPALYGLDADKVILHMDSASSHTAGIVTTWLNDHNMKFISKGEWLANSPELSPMDFFANGYFKNRMNHRKYTTPKGMLKVAHEEWAKIPLQMFQNSFVTWPDRVMAVHKANGNHAPKY